MPVLDTVAPAPVTDKMPYVSVSPASASAPERVPVTDANVSEATVSVKAAVEGVASVGALFSEIDSVELAEFPLPAASVKALPNTDIEAVPAAPADTVNVAV